MFAPLQPLPDPGDRGVPRYSARPFPAYRFVPGLHPHPRRDRDGHSYQPNLNPTPRTAWTVENWRQLTDWLYGVDLFNAFYFWEAHEAWEGLWLVAEPDAALMLQGVIQIAAALLKTHMRVLDGARILSAHGLEKLRHVANARPMMMGLDLGDLIAQCTRFFDPLERGLLPPLGANAPLLRLISRQ